MPVPAGNGVPCRITIGDTIIFTETVNGYPATAWNGDFVLNQGGIALATIRASAVGSDFQFVVSPESAPSLTPGQTNWFLLVTEIATSERQRICGGNLMLAPDPTASITQTPEMVALAALQTAISTGVTKFQGTSFNGQSTTFRTLSEMIAARDRLQQIVNSQLRDLGLSLKGGSQKIVTRFRA